MEQILWQYNDFGYIANHNQTSDEIIYLEESDISIRNKSRVRRKKYYCNQIIGFDTETYQGKCKLLCRSQGRKKSIYNPTFRECLDFMFYNASKGGVYRFYYNLGFDIGAILKIWGNLDQIQELYDGNTIKYQEYSITYLKDKLFILGKGRKKVYFTDLWQFFHSTLDKAGIDFLHLGKLKNVNAERMNKSLFYWNRYKRKIIEYCERDCEVLEKLGKALIKAIESVNISLPKFLCSSASLAKAHFMKKALIPRASNYPTKILDLAMQTYKGGRFEVFQQGAFPFMIKYDINSEYPAITKRLPSFKYGSWYNVKSLPATETFGFYYVRLNIPKNCYIPTVPIKDHNILTWPTGIIEGWYTWYDLDLMREYIEEFIDGIEYGEANCEYYPFEKEIGNLFAEKARIKNEINNGNELHELQRLKAIYLIVKLTINSLYGCFVETNVNLDEEKFGGLLYNPIYATFITAFGRWKVLKDLRKEDYQYLIAIHTDSITMSKRIDYLDMGNELGQWSEEESGSGIQLGTGQYQIGKKVASRSYSKKQIKSWLTLIKANRWCQKIKYEKRLMRKIGKALKQDKKLDFLNTMRLEKKEIRLNTDIKRTWKYDYVYFGQMLTLRNISQPNWCLKKGNELEVYPYNWTEGIAVS